MLTKQSKAQFNQSVETKTTGEGETIKNVKKTENKTTKKSLSQRFGDYLNTRYKIKRKSISDMSKSTDESQKEVNIAAINAKRDVKLEKNKKTNRHNVAINADNNTVVKEELNLKYDFDTKKIKSAQKLLTTFLKDRKEEKKELRSEKNKLHKRIIKLQKLITKAKFEDKNILLQEFEMRSNRIIEINQELTFMNTNTCNTITILIGSQNSTMQDEIENQPPKLFIS